MAVQKQNPYPGGNPVIGDEDHPDFIGPKEKPEEKEKEKGWEPNEKVAKAGKAIQEGFAGMAENAKPRNVPYSASNATANLQRTVIDNPFFRG